ncbi:MAG: helix-turn-helix domain-containing protein [Rhizobium rhizophilum]
MLENHIGERLKLLRVKAKLDQTKLAEILGLKDRQSVSAIETGQRRLSADELVRVIEHFGVTLDWLTNPFLLVSRNNAFSWRQKVQSIAELDAFEALAGQWIAAFRELNAMNGTPLPVLLPRLGLTDRSSKDEASATGERVAAELDLGDRPAFKLAETLQARLGILVLMVDAPKNISGAACRLTALNAILINRHERQGRRSTDAAHEFFHLGTWNEMPPPRVESSEPAWEGPATYAAARYKKIEQLADSFAAGLLMPSWALDQLGQANGDLAAWLAAGADYLGVSARSLRWRLVNTKREPQLAHVSDDELRAAYQDRPNTELPPLFSRAFVETLGRAIEQGNISIMRAAQLVDLPRDELAGLFHSHGVVPPTEL